MHVLCRLLVIFMVSTPFVVGAQESASSADDASSVPNLAGTWAQKVVTTAVSDVPVVGEVTTRTVSIQQVVVDQSDKDLELTTRVCDIDVHSSIDAVQTHIPDKFVAAMGTKRRDAKLVERGGDFVFFVPRHTETLGVRLRNPSHEYLPTDRDDPRVFDQDQDGHPGVTVNVSGVIDGSLYIVHRGWDRLLGEIEGKDRIEGGVKWDLEQKVLDSTSIFLGDPPESRAHSNASKSYFRMQRVPDGTSCTQILQKQAKL